MNKAPNEWSAGGLLTKAQRYASLMLDQSRDDWQFGFWSALCLEMIVRASIAQVSPALLADAKDWKNIAFALGNKPIGVLSPKSIDISEAVSRTQSLMTGFTKEMANFCTLHFQRRNAELHSGLLSFDELGTSWLPQYYSCCQVLLDASKSSLEQIFGAEEANLAATLIQGMKDDAAKAVKGTISEHQVTWNQKSPEEKLKLAEQAEIWASKSDGHRASCPSCTSIGLLKGAPSGPESSSMRDGFIVIRQPMIPSHFECKACGLKVNGFSKLNVSDLGGTYTSTVYMDPVDYFEDDFKDRYSGMEEDNNEP